MESLPTGGWGYDHFPVSAKYCANLPYDVMGMTGKFDTTPVTDIGILSSAAVNRRFHDRESMADVGAGRILLEGHFLFDVLDAEMAFSGRKALVLPDDLEIGPDLKTKLDSYLAEGGKLILSGRNGLNPEGTGFFRDIGALHEGGSPYQPDYILPIFLLRPAQIRTSATLRKETACRRYYFTSTVLDYS